MHTVPVWGSPWDKPPSAALAPRGANRLFRRHCETSPWNESPKTTPSHYRAISGTWVELVETNRAGFRAALRSVPGAKRRGEPLPALSRRVEFIETSSKGPLEPVGSIFLHIIEYGSITAGISTLNPDQLSRNTSVRDGYLLSLG